MHLSITAAGIGGGIAVHDDARIPFGRDGRFPDFGVVNACRERVHGRGIDHFRRVLGFAACWRDNVSG